jgi:hypothetical protein
MGRLLLARVSASISIEAFTMSEWVRLLAVPNNAEMHIAAAANDMIT